MARRRAVFLDRDGVINRCVIRGGKPYAPEILAQLQILPGVREALQALRLAGFFNIIVTNQPDVGCGKQRRELVEAMHDRLLSELAVDAVKSCFHTDAEMCACRKPKPGMLIEAAAEFEISLVESYMVGDRWRDVGAGQAAGCRKVFFIDYGYRETQPQHPYTVTHSLLDATNLILSEFSTTQ